ncbi:MAG TPA: transporter [Pyrinomonadaceae bacterium]|nr:transporter [Pyrinomonadaceae bacterium]
MLRRRLRWACFAFVIALLAPATTNAQLPFYTDDADTTPKHKFHLELSNEHDWLQRSSFPGKRQNTTVFTLNYGLTDHIELGINAPLIKIFNDRSSLLGNPSGIGDTQFGVKIRLLDEREGSKRPATAVVFYAEAPTGSTAKQIGSGLVDYWLYGVLQKSFTKRTVGRLNGGILFAGNGSTGLIGIQSARGQVFTGNGSLVRNFAPRLRLGAEVFGAVTKNFALSRGQLEGQFGGGYTVSNHLEITFGMLGGRYSASPRFGLQLGFAYDF